MDVFTAVYYENSSVINNNKCLNTGSIVGKITL